MVSRKKKDPAQLRTLGLFTGKTPLGEAELELEEIAPEERTGDPRDMVNTAEETAVRWLGLDAFNEGDDVKVAVHPKGHAVLVFVRSGGPNGAPFHTATFKMSVKMWSKLKQLAREDG